MIKTMFGFYWNHNVHHNGVAIPSMGKVFYVVDDYGNLTLVNRARLNYSLA